MLLGHDVVADRETETGALAGRLGGEKRLEQLVLDIGGNTDAVIPYPDFHRIAEIARRDFQRWFERWVVSLLLSFSGGIEPIAEQVQTDARDILRYQFNRNEVAGVIPLERDVEVLILGTATVVGEVQRFLDQSVEIDAATFAGPTARMLQHALYDAVSTPPMFADLFEVAGQCVDCLVDLSALVYLEASYGWSRDFLQFRQ